MNRTSLVSSAAMLMVFAAASMTGCANTHKGAFAAEAAPSATLAAIEGDWAPESTKSRLREISFERKGKAWVAEVERVDDVGNEVEESYPARVITVGGRTILEIEIARGQTKDDRQAAAYFYSAIDVQGDRFQSRAINAQWLREYAQTHASLKIAAIDPWGSERRALGVGRAEGLSKMVQTAAATDSAWDQPSTWVRIAEDRDDADDKDNGAHDDAGDKEDAR